MSKNLTVTSLAAAALMSVAGAAAPAHAGISFGLSLNLGINNWCAPYTYAPVYTYAPAYSYWDSCATARYWRYDPCLGGYRWFDYDPDCVSYTPAYSYYPAYTYYPTYYSGYVWNGPYYYPNNTWGIGFSSGNFFFGFNNGWNSWGGRGWNNWGWRNRWDRWDHHDDRWDHDGGHGHDRDDHHDGGHHGGDHHDGDAHHGGGGGAHFTKPVLRDHPFTPGGHTQSEYLRNAPNDPNYGPDNGRGVRDRDRNARDDRQDRDWNRDRIDNAPQAFGHADPRDQTSAKPNFTQPIEAKPVIDDAKPLIIKPAAAFRPTQFDRERSRTVAASSFTSKPAPIMAQPIESKPIAPVAAKPIESKPVEQARTRNTARFEPKPAPVASKPVTQAERVYAPKPVVPDVPARSAPPWAGRNSMSDKPAKVPEAKPVVQAPAARQAQRDAAPMVQQSKPAEQPREFKAPTPQARRSAPVMQAPIVQAPRFEAPRMEAPKPQMHSKPARVEAPRREAPAARQSAPAPSRSNSGLGKQDNNGREGRRGR